VSDCCQPQGEGELPRGRCPVCEVPGHPVPRVTLESLLLPELRSEIGDAPHRFCPTPSCDVVYFDPERRSIFRRGDLTAKVHQKEPDDPDVPVCYCFGHTPRSMAEEVERTGESTTVREIRRRIQEEGCTCERTNPQGRCCLGNVAMVVRNLRRAQGAPARGENR